MRNLLEKVYPMPPVGGLEVGDTAMRLGQFKQGSPDIQGFRLPPGVIAGGQVKDKNGFVAALKAIFKTTGNTRKMGVVLTLPVNSVFIQTVNLPPVALRNLEEAAELNIQMVSPLRHGQFYSDWQRVERDNREGAPIEILGAFVARKLVDDLSYCFREAGTSLVAVEFTSLSLVRELARKNLLQSGKPYLIAEMKLEGIVFILTFGNQLLFHSFRGWSAAEGRNDVKAADLLAVLKSEINEISNFYLAHWGGVVQNLIFVSSALEAEIKETFKEKPLVLLKPEEAVPVLGAAGRSILGEKEINLLGISSFRIFEETRALNFVSFWRTIGIAIFSFLLLLSLGSDLFLRQLAAKTTAESALALNEPGHRELLGLKEKATKFNGLVALLRSMQQASPSIREVAETVNNLAGSEIRISRFYIPAINETITVSGVALNEGAAIDFKNRLAAEKTFTAVELPISGIMPETGGRVSFTIYLKVANANPPK